MKVVFVSNYFNHHQSSIADELSKITNNNFIFVETEPMEKERLNLGWLPESKPYIRQAYGCDENKSICMTLINNADVVIWGEAPKSYLKYRKKRGLLIFRYSERLFKDDRNKVKNALRGWKHYLLNVPCKNDVLLCASAFSANDYNKLHLYTNRALKWGYFPPTKKYDNDALFANKNPLLILWAGRLVEYKHPEIALLLAKRLQEDNIQFKMELIGCGHLEEKMHEAIIELNLDQQVRMLGSMSPEKVRIHMEEASIFLFTSDRGEGWGAVANEAMNSGCVVVGNSEIGSIPYLIENSINGYIVNNNDVNEYYYYLCKLLKDAEETERVGRNAIYTIYMKWNPTEAANRLISIADKCLLNEDINLFTDGPCSNAL